MTVPTKRRVFLQALGFALASPAWAQNSARVYRIGWLSGGRAAAALPYVRRTLLPALAELGYVEGRNLQLEARFAEGQTERLPELAAELVRASVDVIVASTNLPAFAEFRQFTDAGGLMSYGANFEAMLRDGAQFVARILKGAKPAELPMERPTRFEMVLNLKTAKALGMVIPQSLLLCADEVIQ